MRKLMLLTLHAPGRARNGARRAAGERQPRRRGGDPRLPAHARRDDGRGDGGTARSPGLALRPDRVDALVPDRHGAGRPDRAHGQGRRRGRTRAEDLPARRRRRSRRSTARPPGPAAAPPPRSRPCAARATSCSSVAGRARLTAASSSVPSSSCRRPNDNRAGAQAIAKLPGSVRGTTLGATGDEADPSRCGLERGDRLVPAAESP